jgi:hypothetical protein
VRLRSPIITVAIVVLSSECALSHSRRPPDNPKLHHVKSVFFPPGDEKSKSLEGFLAEALARRGFVIVGSESDSNATVTVGALDWIGLDTGDRPLPSNYGFIAEVRSPALGVNWQTTIHSVIRETQPDAQRRNMDTIGERFFKAWKESAVRAGDLTAAQARSLKRIG